MPLFLQLHDHELETEAENNHIIYLVKRTAREYVKIRNYHWGKKYTASVNGSKLILFKNQ